MLCPNRVARFRPSLESESKLHQGEGEKRRGWERETYCMYKHTYVVKTNAAHDAKRR